MTGAMPRTGATLLVETLLAAGIRHLFTLSGNQILSIYDATIGCDLDIIHTRHEAAAVHMADAWGRLTEQPGVALVTAGPGHGNALSALYIALMAESPMVLLSGHCPKSQMGQGAFQEIDQVAMARPVTKASWLAEDAQRLHEDIESALTIASSGRPGPVHISLPSDVLDHVITGTKSGSVSKGTSGANVDADAFIVEALDLLAAAKRPLILCGPAMCRPHRWSHVQHVSTITGIPALPMESPRGVNDPSLRLAPACLAEADVVVLIGKKLDFTLRFGQPPALSANCRFIQIDADADPPGTSDRMALRICADPSEVADRLASAAQKRTWPDRAWKAEVEDARRKTPPEWKTLHGSSRPPIHPLRVCAALQPFLDDDAVLVSDGGEFGQWMQAGLQSRCRLINGPSGAIGGAIPMALAARLARPRSRVFVTVGDGAFGYHALEFDTAVRYQLPVIAVVGNDARWNAEHQLQVQQYGLERAVGCDLLPSRYDRVVEALGGHGEFVRVADELAPALRRAVESERPACVNVVIDGVAAPVFGAGLAS